MMFLLLKGHICSTERPPRTHECSFVSYKAEWEATKLNGKEEIMSQEKEGKRDRLKRCEERERLKNEK